jgi:hypothetical protein
MSRSRTVVLLFAGGLLVSYAQTAIRATADRQAVLASEGAVRSFTAWLNRGNAR